MERGKQRDRNLTAFSAVNADGISPLKLDDLLKRLMQVMPIGYIVWDTEFRVLLWNPAAEQIFGYSAAEALGKRGYELIVPPFAQAQMDNIWSWLLVGDAMAPNVKQNITKNRTLIVCDWFNSPFRTADGTVVILSLVQNITEAVKATLAATQAEEALRESEQRYRRIVETAAEGILMLDADSKTTFANHRMAQMLGYTVDEMLGRSLFEFMDERERTNAATLLERRRQGIEEQHDFKFRRKDGSELWVILCTTPIFDRAGEYTGTLAMVSDITSRKQAEQELRHMSLALENAVEGISRIDTQGRYVSVNRAYANIIGYTPEEMIGMEWEPTVHPEDLEKMANAYQSMLAKGKAEVEVRGIRKDGSVLHKAIVIIPAYDDKGQFTGHYCFMKDITARKQSEEQLLEQAALLNITPDAILVLDLENRIVFWNKGAETLYGWKAESVIGKKFEQLLCEDSRQDESGEPTVERSSPDLLLGCFPPKEVLKEIISGKLWQGELRQRTKDSKEILVESRWTLVRDDGGKPKSIFVVNTDITQKKKLEAQFLRAQRIESIGTLASGIAHDLNNVLTPILASVQLLKRLYSNERAEHLLTMVEASARRGADLVKQVLSFGRGLESDRTILQVGHLISEIAKIGRETFPKSIEVSTDLSNDLWLMPGDATQLHQVLMNLAVNARDAMPNGGFIKISAENFWIDENYARMHIEAKVGPYVSITVSDTGMGIAPEIVDRIFEPFFTTKEHGKGTGLGLSTVIGIVKSHGGFVSIYSEIGKGTQFKLFFPAVQTTETQERATTQQELPFGNGEWILVADDEVSIRDITKTSLETYGYNVITGCDGIEAIALYAQHKDKISVVLVDIMMPIMDGLTTIRTLRKIKPQVKVIAISGLGSNHQAAKLTDIGVRAFLSKPYTAEDLLKVLHEVLNS